MLKIESDAVQESEEPSAQDETSKEAVKENEQGILLENLEFNYSSRFTTLQGSVNHEMVSVWQIISTTRGNKRIYLYGI